MPEAEVFFLGNCQISRMAQFYGAFQPADQKGSMLFRSITPHFGEYHEDESKCRLETASIAVVQLINADYVFNRTRVLDMRGGKPTIFVPYVYLPGFRLLEKLSSKGRPWIDGEDILLNELDRLGNVARAILRFMNGQVDGNNQLRLQTSLDEMQRREEMGADVEIAAYIRATYRERMPCYSINHPAPHVLFMLYNQVAKLAGFAPVPENRLTHYQMGRAVLPQGVGALTPYCVENLGLSYGAETHWFSATNRLAVEIGRKWERNRHHALPVS